MSTSTVREGTRTLLGASRYARLRDRIAPLWRAPLDQSIGDRGWDPDRFDMSDAQAAVHFANDVEIGPMGRTVIRYFHQLKLDFLRRHLPADYVAGRTFFEIGDSDGLLLKALGKQGFSINNDPRCVQLIGSNGVEAVLGLGERVDVPDKSYDVVMAFETLEHSLAPLAFLQETCRIAREKVILSIPGVTRTRVHPRTHGTRVGEEHVFEFCSRDLLKLATHLPLKLAHFENIPIFAPPRAPLARLFYWLHRNPDLFGDYLRAFDFYIFDLDGADHGVTAAANLAIYDERR